METKTSAPQEPVSQSSESSSPQAAPSPSPQATASSSTQPAAPQKEGEAVATQAADGSIPQTPPYSPNYKFKSFEKEYEMDEFIRPIIKDKDTEEKLRSLYAKGYSFDVVMPKYKDVRDKYQTLDQQYKTLTENISMLESHLNQGDFDGFFNTLQIPEQSIYKWVLDKLNYQELPQKQRQQLDSYRQAQQQKIMLERDYQRLQQQHEQMTVQARTMELNTTLSRPEVVSVASMYDKRMGKEGAFRDLVIERGQLAHWRSEGKVDLTTEEAVREALALVGEMQQQAEQAQVAAQPQVQANQAQARPPVIPTVQGKGASTVRKIPKTLDDIKQMARDAGA